MDFKELGLRPRLLQAIADRGYREMTAVQELTLAETLGGRDVTVQSQTGTGKTAAFLVTLLEHMLRGNTRRGGRMALVIVPTRELAVQIEKEALLLNRHMDFRIGSLYGGVGYASQEAMMRKGLDIVIGTPGRLLDFSSRGRLKLKDVGFLVIDEADRLFDMGFLPDITRLLERMPPRKSRQNMLFSATLNRAARRISDEYLNRPVPITVTPEQMTVDTIEQELYQVKSHLKMNLMLGILNAEAPRNALIFTNTRQDAFYVSRKLQINGHDSRHLTGDLPQSVRLQIMSDFMAGKFPMLVATDVAARGLQIDGLEMVINYDLPLERENYVHRIGRTARAGETGKAVSLASEGTIRQIWDIESFIGMKIPVLPTAFELYATDKSEGSRISRDSRPARSRSRHGSGPEGKRPRKRRGRSRPASSSGRPSRLQPSTQR
jgi:ATP-dependent RNA helicase RhlB